ncbi:MAG: glycosyltransferase [Candidatus Woesebacteria bacterium]|nr:glycosyltransferase [Candidatus Woesebacteria bacterium]
MKTAIVYDRVNKWGGAERVLLALHEIFPDAPLYTSVYDPIGAPWAKVFPKIKTSFLQKFPFARSNHELLAPLMPLAFESFDLTKFDLVISVLIAPFVDYLRKWDKVASSRPDKIIAISSEVKNRIKKYYGRESEIIFPPVNTSMIRINRVNERKHYLVVSRLVSYKKVDLVIEAFNKLGYPLVIVGTGREEKKLKRKARNNIKFAGQVSEKDLTMYYTNAKALIMPQEEDFGIVAVEAQSFGVPVIAYKKGGTLDTVVNGVTGLFFEKQTFKPLEKAIKYFNDLNHRSIKPRDCIENASKFSKERFKREFVDFVKNARMSL